MGAAAWANHWAQIHVNNARNCSKTDLALQAEGLQREGVLRATDEEIGTNADTDRRIGTNAAVMSAQSARANAVARRVNRPSEACLRGNTKVKAKTMNGGHIRVRTTINTAENTLKLRRRSHDVTDILTAFAFQNTGLNGLLGIGGSERGEERRRGDAKKSFEAHTFRLPGIGLLNM